jgi:hypothetical protein
MSFKVALVEDADRTYLPRLIEEIGDGDFEVVALPPPPDLDLAELLSADADLFLVDYELDTQQPDGSVAPYLGMTFASRLREVRPAYPIVLLTRSDLPSWTAAQRTARTSGSFDDIVYKDTGLEIDPDATHSTLASLARGYQTLRESNGRTVDALLDLLETNEGGREAAREALPPSDGWRESEAAHWIRSVLTHFPGVLYDEAHAATALGIAVESFKHELVQHRLRSAEYQGPFCEEQQRWWRHSLFDIANRLCADTEQASAVREGFRLAVFEALGLELTPSADDETGASPADTICYLLGVPVRVETSLPYKPDARPPIMEEARVSFRAIRESNDVDETYIDSANRALLDEIRSSP